MKVKPLKPTKTREGFFEQHLRRLVDLWDKGTDIGWAIEEAKKAMDEDAPGGRR